MSKSAPGFEAHPAVADAIQRASLYSVQVRFEEHLYITSTLEVICFLRNKKKQNQQSLNLTSSCYTARK
jgi:hypothetical protein